MGRCPQEVASHLLDSFEITTVESSFIREIQELLFHCAGGLAVHELHAALQLQGRGR